MNPRRRAIAGLVAAVAAAPSLAREGRRSLGYLGANPPPEDVMAALARLGYTRATNLRIEYRQSDAGDPELGRKATALAGTGVDAILTYSDERTLALRRATSAIPIVTGGVSDPVSLGFARSLAQPGYNVTGVVVNVADEVHGACNMLKLLLPSVARVLSVHSSDDPLPLLDKTIRPGTERSGLALELVGVATARDVDRLVEGLNGRRDALCVVPWLENALFDHVMGRAAKARAVTFSTHPTVPEGGGVLSYTQSFVDHPGRVAALLAKVLRGGNPAGIPFEQPDRVDLVVNARTARTLGLPLPPELMLRATRIIE